MTRPTESHAFEHAEEAATWWIRIASSPLDSRTLHAFDTWIASDPENAMMFEQAVAAWQGVDSIKDTPEMICFRAEAVEALRRANERRWSRGIAGRWRPCVRLRQGWQWR